MKADKFLIIILTVILSGCAHYSVTAERAEEENTIIAPIETVWQKTIELLPSEQIEIISSDKTSYTIKGRKSVTVWSWGDDVTIKFYPRSSQKTVIHVEAHPALGTTLIGWGHQERMTISLFEKIKTRSEAALLTPIVDEKRNVEHNKNY